MALHVSGKQLLKSGQYSLLYYRPWNNDCHTYVKHAQELMNKQLPDRLKQEEIVHHRYQPNITKDDIQAMKATLEHPKHARIIITPQGPNYPDYGLDLNKDKRNEKRTDRKLNDRLDKSYVYFPQLIKRFAQSLWQRITDQTYERNAKNTIAKISDMQKYIANITDTIFVNSVNILQNLPAEKEADVLKNDIFENSMGIENDKISIHKNLVSIKSNLIKYRTSNNETLKKDLEIAITEETNNLLENIASIEQKLNQFTKMLNEINAKPGYAYALQNNLTQKGITPLKSMHRMNTLALQDIKKSTEEILYNIKLTCPCQELKNIATKHKNLRNKKTTFRLSEKCKRCSKENKAELHAHPQEARETKSKHPKNPENK
jgi:hypothetical protein